MNRSAADRPAKAVPLNEVVERLEREGLLVRRPPASPLLSGITDDSRAVRRGDLFCAWAGTHSDAHAFVPAAVQAGAAAVLVERPLNAVVPEVVARDGRRAAAVASHVVHGDPAADLLLAGVTGTNGKTTTVWLLRHLLGARWSTASIGTLGTLHGVGAPVGTGETLTTPGPVELPRTLRALRDQGADALAMEVSSHALHQGRVHGLRFDVAVFTNLSRDHLDYHGSLEEYRAAKLLLAGLLRPRGVAVVNAADAAWVSVPLRAPRTLRYALEGLAADVDLLARAVRTAAGGSELQLVTGGRQANVRLPLAGAFNVENALAAAGAALALGFELEEIAQRLAQAPQVPGRLERIASVPCPVLRDYAHTPDALERVLRALRPVVAGRLIVVFGAGGDRDRGKRPLMGAAAERFADVAFVTSDNPRTEDPDAIIDEIVAGMTAGRHVRVTDRREAIRRALESARGDDLVLLAGKGHETYQIVGTQKRAFDERDVVADLVGRLAPGVGA